MKLRDFCLMAAGFLLGELTAFAFIHWKSENAGGEPLPTENVTYGEVSLQGVTMANAVSDEGRLPPGEYDPTPRSIDPIAPAMQPLV